MKQAKVLTDKEFQRALKIISAGRHAKSNRIAILLSHYAARATNWRNFPAKGDNYTEPDWVTDLSL